MKTNLRKFMEIISLIIGTGYSEIWYEMSILNKNESNYDTYCFNYVTLDLILHLFQLDFKSWIIFQVYIHTCIKAACEEEIRFNFYLKYKSRNLYQLNSVQIGN